MECTLMHKNIPVIDMEILSEIGRIVNLKNPQNPEHLPLGTRTKDGAELRSMDEWWAGRSIPASRDGIRSALQNMGIRSPTLLIEKCYGFSLSDQYWFRPKGAELKWEDINFFQNEFSKDMGEILFGRAPGDPARLSLLSPDNTSDGWLRKKWIVADGKRFLMKGGSGVFRQEPFNEVIASAVMRRLNISHVTYTLIFERDRPYSLCENFVTPDTELVPAWRVWESRKRNNRDSALTHLLKCCEALDIPDVSAALEKMLTLDYIIANEDRHFNNFGFVRNAETLAWKGLAPVFDSGTSLWYDSLRVGAPVESKPFRKTHEALIKLVKDLRWFDCAALDGVKEECAEILARSGEIDAARREKISEAVALRCARIARLC